MPYIRTLGNPDLGSGRPKRHCAKIMNVHTENISGRTWGHEAVCIKSNYCIRSGILHTCSLTVVNCPRYSWSWFNDAFACTLASKRSYHPCQSAHRIHRSVAILCAIWKLLCGGHERGCTESQVKITFWKLQILWILSSAQPMSHTNTSAKQFLDMVAAQQGRYQ